MKVLYRRRGKPEPEVKCVEASILSVVYRDKDGAMRMELMFDPDTPDGEDFSNLHVMAETILETLTVMSEKP
jgi:hypothetical protein